MVKSIWNSWMPFFGPSFVGCRGLSSEQLSQNFQTQSSYD